MRADPAETSINMLCDRCSRWFATKQIEGRCFFPDRDVVAPIANDEEVINVIFFGNFVRRFLESEDWTPKKYRLWVLSSAVRDVMIELLGFPSQQIGVIPRYELFPVESPQRRLPDCTSPFTLIFGGRLSPTKNIAALVHSIFLLQIEYQVPVTLALVGDFDNLLHPDLLHTTRAAEQNHHDKILALSDSLPWRFPPLIQAKLPAESWHKQDFENPVFINLSTFIFEDFDVSLAQTQAAGWPSIVSAWGGHLDAQGSNTYLLPPALLDHGHVSDELVSLRARQLAAWIYAIIKEERIEGFVANKIRENSPHTPVITYAVDLESQRKKLVNNFSELALELKKGYLPSFIASKSGIEFFSRYRSIFSGPSLTGQNIVVTSYLHHAEKEFDRHLTSACKLILRQALKANEVVSFSSIWDIFRANELFLFLGAKRIIFPLLDKSLLPLINELVRFLPDNIPLLIYYPSNPLESWVAKLESTLRPQDCLQKFIGDSGLERAIVHDFQKTDK